MSYIITGKGNMLSADKIFSIEIYKDIFNIEHFIVNGVELKHLDSFCKDWLKRQTFKPDI